MTERSNQVLATQGADGRVRGRDGSTSMNAMTDSMRRGLVSLALAIALGAPGVAAAATVTQYTDGTATAGWTNPGNAVSSNNVYATATTPGTRNSSVASDFGGFTFASVIPAGSTVNSVTVEVEWKVSTTASIATLTAQPVVSGATVGTALSNTAEPTTDTIGSQLSTGISLANLSSFAVRVTATEGATTTPFTASLDYVSVTVDYTPPASGTITIGNSADGEAVTTLAPGSGKVPLDAFTLTASTGTASPSSITVTMPVGSAALIDTLSIENTSACNQPTPYGSVNPASDTPQIGVGSLSVGTTAVPLWVCVKPKSHAAMAAPPGSELPVTGQVTTVVASGYTQQGSDTVSAARTIDNQSPTPAISGVSGAAGPGQVTVSWTGKPSDADFTSGGEIVVLASTGSISAVPVEGTDYAGGETIVAGTTVGCVAGPDASSCIVYGLSSSSSYYFKAFARDSRMNYSAGSSQAGPVTPQSFVAEGDTYLGSEKPMVSIVNPMHGAVLTLPARVQIRVFSPASRPISVVGLTINGASKTPTKNTTGYTDRTTAYSGFWEYTITSADGLPTGTQITLQASAQNDYALPVAGPVLSRAVAVSITAGRGDGNVLVRDNANQLCNDCHRTLATHSSETTGTKYGSWATACRDCHTPHETTNIGLIRTQITPPSLTKGEGPLPVSYRNRGGYTANSFASTDRNGPCQVCHTRTGHYRQDGSLADHETGSNCISCHTHTNGLRGSCTSCHGTDGRVAGVPNADSNIASAPPALVGPTTPTPNTAPTGQVTAGNGHLLHLNQANFRTDPIKCVDCHATNTHKDGKADVAWGTLAKSGSFVPTPAQGAVATAGWPTTPTCTNWCHGQGLAGGGGPASFNWTSTTALGCSSCHGAPPPVDTTDANDHPNSIYCSNCHGAGYIPGTMGAEAKLTHINGTINKPANGCTACHGLLAGPTGPRVSSGNMAAAPGYSALAVDTHGNTNRSSLTVGAHIKHVNDGLMPANCTACHALPADYDTLHADGGAAEVAFDALASKGVTKSYSAGNCTVYCHSGGVPPGSLTATPKSPLWTSTTALGCTDCHEKAAMATNAHGKHVGTLGRSCSDCHFDTTTDGNTIVAGEAHHVDGTNEVVFDGGVALVTGGSYTSPTCSNIYCHSNGNPAGGTISHAMPSWTDAPYTGCTQCHGSATTLVTNAHAKHLNQSSVIGTNYVCADCHNTVVASGNSPITGASDHVNGTKQIGIANRGSIASTETYASNSCDTTYCHSSGQRNYTYRTIVWTTGTLTCAGCHGTTTTTGAPDYGGTGTADTATANSHAAHAANSTDCATCHNGYVTAAGTAISGSSHTNGAINMGWDTTKAGSAVTFVAGTYTSPSTYTSATCANVKCHGYNATALKWGGPSMKCSDCHTNPTADTDSFAFGTAGVISVSEWTGYGHGQTTFGTNTLPTISAGTPCLYCHDGTVGHDVTGNPYRLRGATGAGGAVTNGNYSALTATSANQVCLNCHATAGANGVYLNASNPLKTATKKVDAYHYGIDHGTRTGGYRCWDCHDPHGDGTNVKMVGSKVVQTSTDNHSWAATRITGVAFTANAAGTDYANTSTASLCRACHVTALHYNLTTNDGHNSGAKCVVCHAHQQAPTTNGFKEATACNACHNAPPTLGKHGNHDEVTTFVETSYANAVRHASSTQYGFACNTCHAGTHGNSNNPYAVQVAFGNFDTTAVGGTYTAGAAQTADTAPTGSLTFNWTSGTCSSTYCHSNAAPVGGTSLAAAPTWTETAWTASNRCTKCHQVTADNPGSGTSTKLSHSHWVHITTDAGGGYYFNCSQCHNGVATGQSDYPTSAASISDKTRHVSGAHNVAFDTAMNPGTTGYNQSPAYTCTNTYCHSNGTSAASPPANTSIAWTASSSCASCHGDATTLATGKHPKHANNAALLGTSYYCGDCHKNTVAAGTNSPVTSRANHVKNRTKDVSIANRGTFASSDTTTTCSSTYCHSNGQRQFATKLTVTWSDAAWTAGTECYKCHGTTTTTGAPDYGGTGTADTATANSHAAHASSSTDCATCHNGYVTAAGTAISGSSHTNGAINMGWDTTKAGSAVTFVAGTYTSPSTYTSATCANVKCHGYNATALKWGGTSMKCADCHGGTADANNWSISDGTASAINTGAEWTTYGHGSATVGLAGANVCLYCHDGTVAHGTATNPFRLRGAANTSGVTGAYNALSTVNGNDICINCHDIEAGTRYGVDPDGASTGYALKKASTKFVDAWHYGADHTTAPVTTGGKRCWDCHDPHGDGTNLHMVGADVLPSSTDDYGLAGTRVTVSFTSDLAGGYTRTTTPWTGVCQACHTKTTYWTNTGGGLTHNSGTDCVGCHTHQQPPGDAFKGAGACSACHLAAAAAGDQDVDNYGYNDSTKATIDGDDWATYGHGATVAFAQSGNPAPAFPVNQTTEGCYYCHAPDQAIAGGNGEISAHGDPANPFRLTNTSAGANKNGVCLVCHGSAATGFDPDGAGTAFTSNKLATRRISATHYGVKHTTLGDGGMFCWDCHDPHGDFNYTAGNRAIAYMIHENPTLDHAGATGWGVPTTTAAAVDFNKAVGGTTTAFDGPDYIDTVSPYNGVCQVCHTSTAHYRNNVAPDGHQTGARCIACHAHDQGTTGAFNYATACNGCHANPPALATHGKHVGVGTTTAYGDATIDPLAGAQYGYRCGVCHSTVSTNHMNYTGAQPYQVTVDFAYDALVYAPGTTKTNETGPTGLLFQSSNGGCQTAYCHDPQGTAYASTAVTWGQATGIPLSCTACHDGATGQATTTLPVAHGKHATTAGYNFGCEKCHATTATSSTALNDRKQHADNDKNDVKFNASPLDQTAGTFSGGTAGTCSNTYCHSNGQDRVAPFTSGPSIAWNTTAAADCTSCHAGDKTALTQMSSGSHAVHVVTSGYYCSGCHNTTVTSTTDNRTIASKTVHVNGTADVAIASTYDSNGATSNWNGTQCSGITCHGSGTPTWGGAALNCADCHGGTADVNNWSISDGTLSRINTGTEWTTYGHGSTTVGLTGANVCLYCHDGTVGHGTATNPFRLRGAANSSGVTGAYSAVSAVNGNDICINCHDVEAGTRYGVDPDGASTGYALKKASTKFVDAWHYGADHTTAPVTTGGKRCWDCHDPHGDGTNLHMVGADVLPSSTDDYGLAGTRVTVSFTSDLAGGYTRTTTPWTGVCQACHTKTTYWTNTGGGLTHNSGTDCIGCHVHQQPPGDAFKADAGNCLGCHKATQSRAGGGTVRQIVKDDAGVGGDFQGRSHHVSNGTSAQIVENWDCIVCHAEGKMDATGTKTAGTAAHGNGVVNLLDADSSLNWRGAGNDPTGTSYAWPGAAAATATDRANLDKFCLSCHDANGALYTYNMNPADTAWHPATPSGTANAGTVRPFDAADTVTSSNDGVVRPPTASVGGATRGTVLDVKGQFNPTGSYAYHALVFWGTSRYTSAAGATSIKNARGFTAGNYCAGAACDDTSRMYCTDCHRSDYNSHGSQNADYMLKCYTGNSAGGCTADGADVLGDVRTHGDAVCFRCHPTAAYNQTTTHVPGANAQDWSEGSFGTTQATRQVNSGSLFGLGCHNCHGGTTFGSIHGSAETITPVANQTAYTRKAWRFMNGASQSEWRSMNTSTTSDSGVASTDNARWSGSRTWDCYTLGNTPDRSPAYGSCTQHSRGGKTGTGLDRTLNY